MLARRVVRKKRGLSTGLKWTRWGVTKNGWSLQVEGDCRRREGLVGRVITIRAVSNWDGYCWRYVADGEDGGKCRFRCRCRCIGALSRVVETVSGCLLSPK